MMIFITIIDLHGWEMSKPPTHFATVPPFYKYRGWFGRIDVLWMMATPVAFTSVYKTRDYDHAASVGRYMYPLTVHSIIDEKQFPQTTAYT